MIRKRNIFEPLREDCGTSEVFEVLVRKKDLLLERIVSNGQTTPEGEWYDQEWDEWVILLSGQAVVGFEKGERVELLPGDYLLIPAHCRHSVEFTTTEPPCVWIALHGNL
ncbi:MAG: cupin domain-containing protein [bacterium]